MREILNFWIFGKKEEKSEKKEIQKFPKFFNFGNLKKNIQKKN